MWGGGLKKGMVWEAAASRMWGRDCHAPLRLSFCTIELAPGVCTLHSLVPPSSLACSFVMVTDVDVHTLLDALMLLARGRSCFPFGT